MRDEVLEMFTNHIGDFSRSMTVPDTSLAKYKYKLPAQLLTFWEQDGWGCYGNGIFWIVNPDDFTGILAMWLLDTELAKIDSYHVFARNAFGDLYVWGEKYQRHFTIISLYNTIYVDMQSMQRSVKNPNLEMESFLVTKEKKSFDRFDVEGKLLFGRALSRLGSLKYDEMYGFEPALIAGGSQEIEKLVKVQLFAHLAILRQFADPQIMNSDVSKYVD